MTNLMTWIRIIFNYFMYLFMNINYCLNKAAYNINFIPGFFKKIIYMAPNTYKYFFTYICMNGRNFLEQKYQFKKFLFIYMPKITQ